MTVYWIEEHFGAAFMPREEYLQRLENAVAAGRETNWGAISPMD